MREIKFRAWHKNNKSMCYNVTTDLLDKDYLEFMQYIGLKDKNDKKIYEGDIVKHHRFNTITKCIFNEKYITFAFKSENEEYFYMDIDKGHLEVIGNIYENPEKLKSN